MAHREGVYLLSRATVHIFFLSMDSVVLQMCTAAIAGELIQSPFIRSKLGVSINMIGLTTLSEKSITGEKL